jgi:small subunit ribosomal protein S17
MADEDKTPETEETPDSIQEEVQTAASEEGAGDTSTVDQPDQASAGDEASSRGSAPAAAPQAAGEPQEVLEPKERRARRRAGKKPAARGPVTPEQRDEERRARRAQTAKLRRAYRLRAKTKTAERRAAAPAPEADHAPEHGPGRAKVRQGIVVSDKADKTIVVRVDVTRRHRRYGKIMRTSSKIHAHDERNDAGAGDTVRVIECRPMSRTKRWRLTDVLERAK